MNISTAIEQINWELSRRSYSNVYELDALKQKLFRIRDGIEPLSLTSAEVGILRVSIHNSRKKINRYDYQELDADKLRADALAPLDELEHQLLDHLKGATNEAATERH